MVEVVRVGLVMMDLKYTVEMVVSVSNLVLQVQQRIMRVVVAVV